MADTNRQIVLRRRPSGMPQADDFSIQDAPIRDLIDGEVLLRHSHLGLAPAARIRMSADPHYAAPTAIGEVIYGQAIGRVVATRNPRFAVGDQVLTMNGGWQRYSYPEDSDLSLITDDYPSPTHYLGLTGSSGFTAFVGLHDIGGLRPDDTVVVSAAAGAVGSIAVQLAVAEGCCVIGIASGAEKCAYVVADCGATICVDRTAPDVADRLERACPDGIDLYFDNAGGAVRDAVWPLMNDFGRVAVCGQIASYNRSEPTAGPEWMSLLTRRLTVRGFLLRDFTHRQAAFDSEIRRLIASGRIVAREHVWRGLESAPAAFAALLSGESFGKVIVALND